MTTSWKTFGHDKIKNILGKQLAAGAFAHAYLFSGPEGIGKKTLALEFAQKILGTAQLNQHPDFQMLAETAGQISVERVREFIGSLGYKPFLAKKKVAMIDNAQDLNQQSGNALLKTLEEPSDSTILILISSGKQLLPTIVSRCQVFNFNAFTLKQLEEFAKAEKLKTDQGSVALAFGSIAGLQQMAQDKSMSQNAGQVIARFEELQNGKAADRLLAVAEFAELEPEELEKTLVSWYYWQAGELEKKPLKFKAVEALGEALQQLRTNKNKKLVLQGLFMRI